MKWLVERFRYWFEVREPKAHEVRKRLRAIRLVWGN